MRGAREKHTDREIAIFASTFYEIEIDRGSQSPFLIFNGQRDHQDTAVKKVQEITKGNCHTRLTVDQLSLVSALSRRSLERRFKSATLA